MPQTDGAAVACVHLCNLELFEVGRINYWMPNKVGRNVRVINMILFFYVRRPYLYSEMLISCSINSDLSHQSRRCLNWSDDGCLEEFLISGNPDGKI